MTTYLPSLSTCFGMMNKAAPSFSIIAIRHTSTLAKLDKSKLEIKTAAPNELKKKPSSENLTFGTFGKVFTDHMLKVTWTSDKGWGTPRITPLEPFKMHPGAKVLHYAQEIFEGLKAYRGVDDQIRLFRPMHNMARMNVSARRSCLPEFDGGQLLDCIRKLIQIDQEWVPHTTSSSLYIRPTMIGTEPALGVASSNIAELFVILCPVGPYFNTSSKGVKLLADPRFARSWPGGSGFAKMGCNYAPTLWVQELAAKHGCQQVLWLHGNEQEITEVGAMNLFVFLEHEDSTRELVTPPLTKDLILPGVTRRSIIEMAKKWAEFEVNERKISMNELQMYAEKDKVLEVFGAGTAAIVSPVEGIVFKDKLIKIPVPDKSLSSRIMEAMSDIYYGKVSHPWAIDIEKWDLDRNQQLIDYQRSETTT